MAQPTDGIRVRSRDDELVPWSRKAARLTGTIRDTMDDAPDESRVYFARTVATDHWRQFVNPAKTSPGVEKTHIAKLRTKMKEWPKKVGDLFFRSH